MDPPETDHGDHIQGQGDPLIHP